MTEQDNISHIYAMRPAAVQKVMAMTDGFLEISDPEIIQAAWGPRRVSSRTRGMKISVYPDKIGAHRKLWLDWLSQPIHHASIVIAKKKAQARIDAALSHVAQNPEDREAEPVSPITQEEIEDMLEERKALRAARRFVEADKIRDYLVSHGVAVADARVM